MKQEVDRNEDMLRSCLRAVDSLARIPAAASSPAFKQFMDTLVLGPALKASSCICGGKFVCAGVGVGMGIVACALVAVLDCAWWSAARAALTLPPGCTVARGWGRPPEPQGPLLHHVPVGLFGKLHYIT